MNNKLKVGDIVKYKKGKCIYILKTLDKKTKTATIEHRSGDIYFEDKINSLVKLNLKFKSFDELPKDPAEYCRMVYGKEYVKIRSKENEQWKEVPNIPWICISNFGRAKSTRDLFEERLMDIFFNKNKHLFIYPQYVDTYYYFKQTYLSIAYFVSLFFVENPNKYKYVRHKDGNSINNNFSNLEWVKRGRTFVEPETPNDLFFRYRHLNKKLSDNLHSYSEFDTYEADDYGDHSDEEIIMRAIEDGSGEYFGY